MWEFLTWKFSHKSVVRVTWLIPMCALTHSHVNSLRQKCEYGSRWARKKRNFSNARSLLKFPCNMSPILKQMFSPKKKWAHLLSKIALMKLSFWHIHKQASASACNEKFLKVISLSQFLSDMTVQLNPWEFLRMCMHAILSACNVKFTTLDRKHTLKFTTLWSKETPPPGGFSYLVCSLIKNREEEDPPWRTTPKIDYFWGWFFRGGPLPPGSWSGNILNRKPPRGGWVLSINFTPNSVPDTQRTLDSLHWKPNAHCETHYTWHSTHTEIHYTLYQTVHDIQHTLYSLHFTPNSARHPTHARTHYPWHPTHTKIHYTLHPSSVVNFRVRLVHFTPNAL